jgi:hypothetical protein
VIIPKEKRKNNDNNFQSRKKSRLRSNVKPSFAEQGNVSQSQGTTEFDTVASATMELFFGWVMCHL